MNTDLLPRLPCLPIGGGCLRCSWAGAPKLTAVRHRGPQTSSALLTSALLLACAGEGVDPTVPRSIVILPEAPRVVVGRTLQLEVRALDGNGEEISDADIDFESSLPAFITVSESGLLTAAEEYGYSMITATWDNISARVQAEIVPPPSVLLVKPESLELAPGEWRELLAWYIDENSEAVWTAEFLFQSDHPAVARVDQEGYVALVTAEAAGTATITVTSGDRSVQVPVTVTQPE